MFVVPSFTDMAEAVRSRPEMASNVSKLIPGYSADPVEAW